MRIFDLGTGKSAGAISDCPHPEEPLLRRLEGRKAVVLHSLQNEEPPIMSKAGNRIIQAAEEALAFAKGKAAKGVVVHTPEDRRNSAQMPVRVPSPRGGEGQDEGAQGVQNRALDKGALS
jgi:hypothetical protein